MYHLTGRYRLGEEAPLLLHCRKAGAADTPSVHPTYEVRQQTTGLPVKSSGRLPASDQGAITGLFRRPLFLDSTFAVGSYLVIYRWTDSAAVERTEIEGFEIIPGGAVAGSVVAMYPVERPSQMHLLLETDAGLLARVTNPR